MEDDTFDFGVNPTVATDPSMAVDAMGLPGQYQALLAQRQARQKEELDASTQRWNDYQEALKAQRAGPSKLQRISAALAAFGAPTQHGSNWEALNAANRSLMETGQASLQADAARKQALAEMAFKQAEAMAQQRSTGAAGEEELQAQIIKAGAPIKLPNGDLIDPSTYQVLHKGAEKPLTSTDAYMVGVIERVQNGTGSAIDNELYKAFIQKQKKAGQFAPARPTPSGVPLPPGAIPISEGQ